MGSEIYLKKTKKGVEMRVFCHRVTESTELPSLRYGATGDRKFQIGNLRFQNGRAALCRGAATTDCISPFHAVRL